MTDPLHVAPGIVGFLDAPNHVRIRAIRTERWIGFGRARRVVERGDTLLATASGTWVSRQPSGRVDGPAGALCEAKNGL